MAFNFRKFRECISDCTKNKLDGVVYGIRTGNTFSIIFMFLVMNFLLLALCGSNFSLYLFLYMVLFVTFMFILLNRKMGFGLSKNGFIYVKLSFFNKAKEFYEFDFEDIKYLNVRKLFNVYSVNISFISKKRLRRVSFNFSSRVLGLDKIEYAKSNKVIRDKLMELQKIMDRGDF